MGYPRRLGGYLPSNLTISGPVVSGGAITGSTLVATSAGAAATPPVKAGASGVGFYEVAANVLGLSTGAAVVMSLGGGNAAVLNGNQFTTTGARYEQGIVSPTALSGSVTDYNPTSLSGAEVLRIDPNGAARTINSLAGGGTGRTLRIRNLATNGAHTLTFLHDDGATGTAAMRFLCPNNASYVATANSVTVIWYDATNSRWIVVGGIA